MAKKEVKSKGGKEIGLLVTTAHRGVFFGYVEKRPTPGEQNLCLKRARNCIRWTSDVQGFLGLATNGPSSSCRIGPAVPELMLSGVTSISVVTDKAASAWEAQPWN